MNQFEKIFVNSRIQYYLHKWFWFGSIVKRLPSTLYQNILEIGTGVGFTAELLAEKYPNAHILATDFDDDSIETAKSRRHSPNIVFQQEDATRLSFTDNLFDTAFSILTLHHIHDYRQAISELTRVVKQGGDVYIMDIPSASFNFFHFRKSIVPGLFTKTELMTIGENFGLKMEDCGGKYLFSLHGKKL